MSFKFNFFDLDESSASTNPGVIFEDNKNDKNKSHKVEFDPIQNIITKKYKKHFIKARENNKLGNIKSTKTNPIVKYRVNTKVKSYKKR